MSKLVSNLKAIAAKASLDGRAAAIETAQSIYATSQIHVPVDKGDLKASGGIEIKADKVIVGYGTDHSVWQEFGTSKMQAQPFLIPAFALHAQEFQVRWLAHIKAGDISGVRLHGETNKPS